MLFRSVIGYVARGQIRRTGEKGAGLARAGVVLGWAEIVLVVLVLAVFLTLRK